MYRAHMSTHAHVPGPHGNSLYPVIKWQGTSLNTPTTGAGLESMESTRFKDSCSRRTSKPATMHVPGSFQERYDRGLSLDRPYPVERPSHTRHSWGTSFQLRVTLLHTLRRSKFKPPPESPLEESHSKQGTTNTGLTLAHQNPAWRNRHHSHTCTWVTCCFSHQSHTAHGSPAFHTNRTHAHGSPAGCHTNHTHAHGSPAACHTHHTHAHGSPAACPASG